MLHRDQQLPVKTKWVGQEEEDRAGKTGFEPATSGVTDQHSNQLSYFPLSSLLSIPKSPTGYLCNYTKVAVQQNAVRLWYSFSFSSTTVERNGSARDDSNGAPRSICSISYPFVGATRDFS